MGTSHSLRSTYMTGKTVMSCTCGEWLETSPLRLGEQDHEDELKAAGRRWLAHSREGQTT